MESSISPDRGNHAGCAYILTDHGEARVCGAPPRCGSSYCRQHHALCHVPSGTVEEVRRLREVEALASLVGGRRAGIGGGPSRQFLRRLEYALRELS